MTVVDISFKHIPDPDKYHDMPFANPTIEENKISVAENDSEEEVESKGEEITFNFVIHIPPKFPFQYPRILCLTDFCTPTFID